MYTTTGTIENQTTKHLPVRTNQIIIMDHEESSNGIGKHDENMVNAEVACDDGGSGDREGGINHDHSNDLKQARMSSGDGSSKEGPNRGNNDEEHVVLKHDDGGDDDDAILKRILQESLADNSGQETYSVEHDNKTGRIIELTIGTTLSAPFDHHWELSPTIHRLDALQKLSVISCRSLPEEIGMMTKLRSVTLIACKRMENLPSVFSASDLQQQKYRADGCSIQIEEFRILGIIPMIPTFLLSRLSGLSKLRVLQYSFHALSRDEELEYVRALISSKNAFMMTTNYSNNNAVHQNNDDDGDSNDPVFRNYAFVSTLEELILNRCYLSTNGMDVLVMDVVPHYPSIKILSVCKNNIRSLKGLVTDQTKVHPTKHFSNGSTSDELGTDNKAVISPYSRKLPTTNLHELILSDNPVWDGPLPSFLNPHEDSDGDGDGEEDNGNNNPGGNPEQLLSPSEVRRRDDEQKEQMNRRQKQEQSYLEEFLVKRAPYMTYLGFRFEKSKLWTPTVQHWLDVNKLCRRLFVAGRRDERRHLNKTFVKGLDSTVEISLASEDGTKGPSSIDEQQRRLLPLVIDCTTRHFRKTDIIFGTLYGTRQYRMSPEARSADVVYYTLRNSTGTVLLRDHLEEQKREAVNVLCMSSV